MEVEKEEIISRAVREFDRFRALYIENLIIKTRNLIGYPQIGSNLFEIWKLIEETTPNESAYTRVTRKNKSASF